MKKMLWVLILMVCSWVAPNVLAQNSLEQTFKMPLVNGEKSIGALTGIEGPKLVQGLQKVENEFSTVHFWILDDPVRFKDQIWLQLWIEPKAGWHTYWKNPGVSGVAPDIRAHIGELVVGAEQWRFPVPKKIISQSQEQTSEIRIESFGYDEPVLFLAPVERSKIGFKGVLEDVGVQIRYGICDVQCVIESASWQLDYPLNMSIPIPQGADWKVWEGRFEKNAFVSDSSKLVIEQLNVGDPADKNVTLQLKSDGKPVQGTIRLASALGWEKNEWYLDDQGRFEIEKLRWQQESSSMPSIDWQWIDNEGAAWQVVQNDTGRESQSKAGPSENESMLWVFFVALVAGALLNVMPCVFPVLGFKLMGLTGLSARERMHQIGAYSAGVVVSFVGLGALVIFAKHAGGYLGWGFQLQNAGFVTFLIVLYTLIGFWFMGWVPSSWGMCLQSVGSDWVERSSGGGKSFLIGVLSVVVAAPCAAPFMGASVGVALTAPAMVGLGIFATLGLGMCLPLILLGWGTKVRLPKPGPWMQQMQVVFGFFMFATVIWLLDVVGGQVQSVFWILVLLLSMSAAFWSLKEVKSTVRTVVLWGTIAVSTWSMYQIVLQIEQPIGSIGPAVESKGVFESWNEQSERNYIESGEVIFIDFTAKWCITCQVNKKAVLEQPQFAGLVAGKNIKVLRADWTQPNAAIAARLAQSGRATLPTYIVKSAKKEVLLPEVLTFESVESAIRSVR